MFESWEPFKWRESEFCSIEAGIYVANCCYRNTSWLCYSISSSRQPHQLLSQVGLVWMKQLASSLSWHFSPTSVGIVCRELMKSSHNNCDKPACINQSGGAYARGRVALPTLRHTAGHHPWGTEELGAQEMHHCGRQEKVDNWIQKMLELLQKIISLRKKNQS